MWVEYGNENAIEGYRDTPDGEVQWRPLEGERITTLSLPDDMPLQEAFTTAVQSINFHFAVTDEETGERAKPAWIESDSEGLNMLLSEHFGLKPDKRRPKAWGKEFNLHKDPTLSLSHPVNLGEAEAEDDDEETPA